VVSTRDSCGREQQQKEYEVRVTELKQELIVTGRPVVVKASGHIVLLLALMMTLSVAAAHEVLSIPGAKSISMLALSLTLTFFVGLLALPFLGKPILSIARDGLSTSDMGFLKWDEIESVGLCTYTTRGGPSYMLCVYVPGLSERERQLSPLLRFRRRMLRGAQRDVQMIPLSFSANPPPVIHGLCYALWNERTGRTSMATAAPSKELLDLQRRADEQVEALKRIETTVEHDPAEAMKLLEELKHRFPISEPATTKRVRRGRRNVRVEAMLKEVSKIDPSDVATRKQVFDSLMKEEVRRAMAINFILIIVGFAAVVTVFVLLN
jgi:hypothetical protein